MSTYPVPRITPELLQEVKKAKPPGKIPKGYFDELVTPTKELLDRRFTLPAAADWFIERGVLVPELRRRFVLALHNRMSRFRQRKAAEAEEFTWKMALGYERMHAIGRGVVAICGAKASRWYASADGDNCLACIGAARKQGVTVGASHVPKDPPIRLRDHVDSIRGDN